MPFLLDCLLKRSPLNPPEGDFKEDVYNYDNSTMVFSSPPPGDLGGFEESS